MPRHGHWTTYTISTENGTRGLWNHAHSPPYKHGQVKIYIFKMPTPDHGTVHQEHTTGRIMVRKATHGWEAFVHMDMFHSDMDDTSWWNVLDGTNFALLDKDGKRLAPVRALRKDLMADIHDNMESIIYTPPPASNHFTL
jgi:hypothetical protein